MASQRISAPIIRERTTALRHPQRVWLPRNWSIVFWNITRLGLEASLYQILQILSVTVFEKTPILQSLPASGSHDDLLDDPNQLILFDF